jgi:hypothetical protein
MGLSALAASAAILLAPQDPESPLGPKLVQMRSASFYRKAGSEAAEKASYGEEVTVLAIEGRFARVTRKKDGSTLYISKLALIDPAKFDPVPESQEEKARLKAENFKAGRFDKETEAEYIRVKGGDMERAYQEVDDVMGRPASKADRATLERELAEFRRAGKLGEFSTVK